IVYCNRGSGGGNAVGNEQSTALGAIREMEARQAAASFGITNVWFLQGRDTPGQDLFQSLATWHHGAVLEDVVRLIRLTRPEVVFTWLPHFVAGENHGDHQAAGVIATEAFDIAGDPTVFPAHVMAPRERTDINNATEGLHPWQPKKLYFFSDASHDIVAEGPAFDQTAISHTRREPYYKIAASLHAPHRTQGETSAAAVEALRTGDFSWFNAWLGRFRLIFGKSLVHCVPTGDVFDGITAEPVAYRRPPGYLPRPGRGVSLALGGPFEFYRNFWPAHGIERVGPLVRPEIEVAAGSYLHIPLLIRNDTPDSASVTLRPLLPSGWREANGSGTYRIPPGGAAAVQTFVRCAEGTTTNPVDVSWEASSAGARLGDVTLHVTLKDWTLPQ
ncbi:MAG: PIG-L family deacetylase, partial [Bacteroidota bacterium]